MRNFLQQSHLSHLFTAQCTYRTAWYLTRGGCSVCTATRCDCCKKFYFEPWWTVLLYIYIYVKLSWKAHKSNTKQGNNSPYKRRPFPCSTYRYKKVHKIRRNKFENFDFWNWLRYEGISPYLVSGCLQTRYLLAQFVSIRISCSTHWTISKLEG